jgi:chromosome segregation ATPase
MDENKEEQTLEAQEAPQSNGAATTEDIDAIKAELEEERQAKAAAQTAIAEKDATIADLQAKLEQANQGTEALTAEKASLSDALTTAVTKYLDAVKLANPTIPGDVITGSTIDEIDASVAKATTIAESVKKSLEAQAKEAKVPAGAPPRTEINIEGLSPREKIAAGISRQSRETGGA